MSTHQDKDLPGSLPDSSHANAETAFPQMDEITKRLEEANRFAVIGRLFPGIAHNINNPLSVIIGHLQLLKFAHPELKELDAVQEQAQQINTIIRALSYKTSREASATKTTINICEMLKNELIVLTADPFYKHEVKKSINLSEQLPGIHGYYRDFAYILQAIINFSLDSMMDVEPKEFSLTVASIDNYITINISDTGKPLSNYPGKSPGLTSVYYQSSRMGKNIVNLAKAYDLIVQYQGELSLTSNTPKGKEIKIRFPGKQYVK